MSPTSRLLEYPFAATQQGEPEIAFMREFTAEYLARNRLFADSERYTQTVVHFARFCTPPGTSEEGLACACMYMAWVLYLDDVSDGSIGDIGTRTVSRYCEIAQSLCDGEDPAPLLSSPADPALVELVRGVTQIADRRGLSVREFCDRLLDMMRAQRWERERSAAENPSFTRSEYLHRRPAAIGNGGFVSIMKLDHAVDVERMDPLARARVMLLDELTSRLVYLSNDILSQHREALDSSALSLVRVITQETGIPWPDAVERAISCHDREVRSYRALRADLLCEAYSAEIARMVTILDANVAGNLAAMQRIHSRYCE